MLIRTIAATLTLALVSCALGAQDYAGFPATRVSTKANVKLEMLADGPQITTIELDNESEVPGIDARAFQEQAEATKKGCPVSKALTGTQITLTAKLKG